ncbi:C6 zinc finger domain protein [Apiospora marii]|uniref:C6 zinc finger domain protein n=1 Tax=Apiospora marii TaxID=335849 RepID=UPI00312D6ECC
MSTTPDSSTSRKAAGPRVVLACIPCRERHVRCSAEQPQCRRCIADDKSCRYAKSRRGGLDRAALEARRRRLEAESAKESTTTSSPSVAGSDQSRDRAAAAAASGAHRQDRSEEPDWLRMFVETPSSQHPQSEDSYNAMSGVSTSGSSGSVYHAETARTSVFPDSNLDCYYLHFHKFHPCVVPKPALQRLVKDPGLLEKLHPLIYVMKYIGSLFQTRSRSKEIVLSQPSIPKSPTPSPFMVQCHLLYSITLYWSDERPRAYEQLNAATDMAVELGMNHRSFAAEHGAGDAVLDESFRRTWWQLLSVEASTAATDRSFSFRVCEIETTVDLPCEEDEYENEAIPTPRTWDDYCVRELETEGPGYSSFAHLVGAYRSITSALKSIPPLTKPHGSALVIQEIDTVIDGWLHLLPESKREVMSESGEIDELMFQAHMLVHTATLTVHRPFSKLLFHPLETMSSCTTYPSDEHIAKESLIVHTTRCLRAIEAQVRLLALPAERFSHTPFIVCMVTTGAIPLLSACRTIFSDEKLAVGRNQLRLIIGCLKALAETWPRAARYVREIQELARILLAVPPTQQSKSAPTSTPTSTPTSGIAGSAGQGAAVGVGAVPSDQEGGLPLGHALGSSAVDGDLPDVNNEWSSADILAAISSMSTIGAGWNMSDLSPGINPWWPSC